MWNDWYILCSFFIQMLWLRRYSQYTDTRLRTTNAHICINKFKFVDSTNSSKVIRAKVWKRGKMGKMAWSICYQFDFGLFILLWWGTDSIERETREDFTIRCRLLHSKHTYCCDFAIPIDSKQPHVPFSFQFFSSSFSSTNPKLNQCDILWHTREEDK